MSIARWTEKNPKVRKDLNILRAVPVLLIKVLTDLENLRDAFFYRHLGPHGPKEVLPLHPELLHRTQTAFILFILSILLQTTKKRTPVKPMARSLARRNNRKSNPSSGLEALHVYSICRESVPSVSQDRLILPRLRSVDRKLQMSDNCIVRGLLAFCCLKSPSVGQDRLILPCLRSGDRKLQIGGTTASSLARWKKNLTNRFMQGII